MRFDRTNSRVNVALDIVFLMSTNFNPFQITNLCILRVYDNKSQITSLSVKNRTILIGFNIKKKCLSIVLSIVFINNTYTYYYYYYHVFWSRN